MDKIDKLLTAMDALLEAETLEESSVKDLIVEFYETLVKKYRPCLKALPDVSEKVINDLKPLVYAIIKAPISFYEDEEYIRLTTKQAQLRATYRAELVKTYLDVGFSRSESMTLMLQDIANSTAQVKDVNDKLSNSQSKK